jgi:uncharacterized protein YqeY
MLEKQILQDYIQAVKLKDRPRADALNFLRAQMKNVLIDKKVESLDDVDVIALIKKQIKQRQDSIEQFKNAQRPELAEKEEAEMQVLKTYLPQEMPMQEIEALVDQGIKELDANSMKDMGRVMKWVSEKAAGRADNKVISEVVKKALNN